MYLGREGMPPRYYIGVFREGLDKRSMAIGTNEKKSNN